MRTIAVTLSIPVLCFALLGGCKKEQPREPAAAEPAAHATPSVKEIAPAATKAAPEPAEKVDPTPAKAVKSAKSEAALKGDMEAICNAEQLSGASGDHSARMTTAFKWISGKIKTQEAKDLLNKYHEIAPPRRADFIRKAAEKAGIIACPLATTLAGGAKKN